jgi:hypothetical protein
MGKIGITLVCLGTLLAIIVGAAIDHDFLLIVTKGDNSPIVGMLILVIFFTWISMAQGVENDRIIEETDGDMQAVYDEMCK